MTDSPPVVVVGQVARDLVLLVDALPEAGGSTPVGQRIEVLGGKGANQAVACAQLGLAPALVGVVGADDAGTAVLRQAADDGLHTRCVARRGCTALLVDVVEKGGRRRLLEHVPGESLVTAADVHAAADVLRAAAAVCLQLQQPAEVLLAAAGYARTGARVVLDGAPDDAEAGARLLRRADVLRANPQEAELLVGEPVTTVAAARQLLDRGPGLVAVGQPGGGDLVVWRDGAVQLPPSEGPVVDPTGGGDTFTAALVVSLHRGASHEQAARAAARATASTVARLGGRPALSPDVLAG